MALPTTLFAPPPSRPSEKTATGYPPTLPSRSLSVYKGSHAFRIKRGLPGPGMLYHENVLREPDSRVRALLLGFHPDDIAEPDLSEDQRCHLLGQCIDINLFSWFIGTAAPTTIQDIDIVETPLPPPSPLTHPPSLPLSAMAPGAFDSNRVFSSSQPLPDPRATILPRLLPSEAPLPPTPPPPTPAPWTPQFDPGSWIYTDGSLIDGESRLGAAVIHSPSKTALHIDASGIAETHTIMRAELVAIYVALDRFRYLKDFRLFTDSLSSLQAIQKLPLSPRS